jgi:hypothetical protein
VYSSAVGGAALVAFAFGASEEGAAMAAMKIKTSIRVADFLKGLMRLVLACSLMSD